MSSPSPAKPTSVPRNARYVMVRQPSTGMVVMIEVSTKNDVFFNGRGLVAQGRLGWNLGFYEILMQTLEDQTSLSDQDFIVMVVTVFHKVLKAGGHFYIKLSSVKFAAWEELSQEKSYRMIARCLQKVAEKKNIEIQAATNNKELKDDEWCAGISKLAVAAAASQNLPSSNTSNGTNNQAPIVAYYTAPTVASDSGTAPKTTTPLGDTEKMLAVVKERIAASIAAEEAI